MYLITRFLLKNVILTLIFRFKTVGKLDLIDNPPSKKKTKKKKKKTQRSDGVFNVNEMVYETKHEDEE